MRLWGMGPELPELIDNEILWLLLSDFEYRPWSVDEVIRRVDADPDLTLKALVRLRRNGVINPHDDYLSLSKPAHYYAKLAGLAGTPTGLPL